MIDLIKILLIMSIAFSAMMFVLSLTIGFTCSGYIQRERNQMNKLRETPDWAMNTVFLISADSKAKYMLLREIFGLSACSFFVLIMFFCWMFYKLS